MLKPLLMAAAVAVLAFALNPSPETHRSRLKAAVAERSPLAGALRLGDLAAFVSTYRTLGVASYTTVNGRVATYGAFGVVLVADLSAR